MSNRKLIVIEATLKEVRGVSGTFPQCPRFRCSLPGGARRRPGFRMGCDSLEHRGAFPTPSPWDPTAPFDSRVIRKPAAFSFIPDREAA
jgi:hypothetical protein